MAYGGYSTTPNGFQMRINEVSYEFNDEENESSIKNLSKRLAIAATGGVGAPKSRKNRATTKRSYIAQCSRCLQWRMLPSKEKYLELRERLFLNPFYCERGKDWRREVACNNPSDILFNKDGTLVWPVDELNVFRPPPGWKRLVKLRKNQTSKFADVYYLAPHCKKRMRSSVEIQKYLDENPQYGENVSLSQFSFTSPTPIKAIEYDRKVVHRSLFGESTDDDHEAPGTSAIDQQLALEMLR